MQHNDRCFVNNRSRRKHGQGITELAFGFLILVPILLLFYDLAVFAISKQALDSYVKDVARSAANQATANAANSSVDELVRDFKPTPFLISLTKKKLDWNTTDPKGESVTVVLDLKGRFPVPIPGLPQDYTLSQHQTEPIVGIPMK